MKKNVIYSAIVLGVLATTMTPSIASAAELREPVQNKENLTRGVPGWAKAAWKITKKSQQCYVQYLS